MRVAIGVALLVGATAGCKGGGGAGSGTAAQPPAIDVACVLGADGANCTFSNKGGPGARCVKVLYGARTSGSVVSYDEVCSGTLAAGQVASLAVRFPRRPGDACGEGVADCTTKVVEPAAAEAEALAWQDTLKAPAAGPLSEAECRDVLGHVFDVMKDSDAAAAATPEERANIEQMYDQMRASVMDSGVKDCVTRVTRKEYDCAMQARTKTELQRCDAGDRG